MSQSKNQELLQEYRKIARQFNAKNLEYIKAYISAANSSNDSNSLDSIQKAMDNLLKRRYLYALNFASSNGDNVIAPYIALTEVSDANIKFLDTVASKLTEEVKVSKYGKLLILHGDQYDAVTSNAKWISKFGGMLYDILIMLNRPMSKYLKNLTKKIVSGASGFQKLVKEECLEGNYAGLMCGHNHRPEILKYKTHIYITSAPR